MKEQLLKIIQEEKNLAEEFISTHRGKSIYLYGAGAAIYLAIQFVRRYDISILGIIDTYKGGEVIAPPPWKDTIPVISFEKFLKENSDPDVEFLISAPSFHKEITQMLVKYFKKEQIHSFVIDVYAACIPDIPKYRSYIESNLDAFTTLWKDLEDEASRFTLDSVLKGRLTAKMEYFSRCYVSHQYYVPDIIHFQEREVMVELGGLDGETLKEFIEICPGFHAVYCFEPDSAYLSQLKAIEAAHPGVHIIQKGAWSSSGTLSFLPDGGAGCSRIVPGDIPNATFQIDVTRIDDAVPQAITYMKMDIEGAELEALKGAEKQIRKNKPKLAVCVYHKPEDFLEIWGYLKSLVPEYRFYLRHHNTHEGCETVLYAIV